MINFASVLFSFGSVSSFALTSTAFTGMVWLLLRESTRHRALSVRHAWPCLYTGICVRRVTRILSNQNGSPCHNRNEHTGKQIETKTKPTTTGHHHKESLGIFVLISEKSIETLNVTRNKWKLTWAAS